MEVDPSVPRRRPNSVKEYSQRSLLEALEIEQPFAALARLCAPEHKLLKLSLDLRKRAFLIAFRFHASRANATCRLAILTVFLGSKPKPGDG